MLYISSPDPPGFPFFLHPAFFRRDSPDTHLRHPGYTVIYPTCYYFLCKFIPSLGINFSSWRRPRLLA